jgi:phage shock protein A
MRDTQNMHRFVDSLSSSTPEGFSQRLQRALNQAEDALTQAKLALAAGDADAANSALDEAGEAHALAQALRENAANQPPSPTSFV